MQASYLSQRDHWGLQAPFAAIHHIALVTNDMKKTVTFYRDVLGSEVALGHRMSRPDKARHYFITVAPNTVFAFFEFSEAQLPEYQDPTQPKTGRALDHIAFFVEDEATLQAWHQRLQGKVEHLSEIQDLGLVRAFFFADPNGIVLEVMIAQEQNMLFPILDDPEPAY